MHVGLLSREQPEPECFGGLVVPLLGHRLRPYPGRYLQLPQCLYQRHDRADDSGLILAFRRAMCPYEQAHVEPGGLDRRKTYRFTNEDTGECFTVEGAELIDKGLTLTIPEKRQSLLLTYKTV